MLHNMSPTFGRRAMTRRHRDRLGAWKISVTEKSSLRSDEVQSRCEPTGDWWWPPHPIRHVLPDHCRTSNLAGVALP